MGKKKEKKKKIADNFNFYINKSKSNFFFTVILSFPLTWLLDPDVSSSLFPAAEPWNPALLPLAGLRQSSSKGAAK